MQTHNTRIYTIHRHSWMNKVECVCVPCMCWCVHMYVYIDVEGEAVDVCRIQWTLVKLSLITSTFRSYQVELNKTIDRMFLFILKLWSVICKKFMMMSVVLVFLFSIFKMWFHLSVGFSLSFSLCLSLVLCLSLSLVLCFSLSLSLSVLWLTAFSLCQRAVDVFRLSSASAASGWKQKSN